MMSTNQECASGPWIYDLHKAEPRTNVLLVRRNGKEIRYYHALVFKDLWNVFGGSDGVFDDDVEHLILSGFFAFSIMNRPNLPD